MRIKTIFFITMLYLITLVNQLFGQEASRDKIFSNAQGIKSTEFNSYEVEGYSIYTKTITAHLEGAAFKKTKKRLGIPKDAIEFTDSTLNIENKVYVSETQILDTINQIFINYFIKENEKYISIISFYTTGKRDYGLEQLFLKSFQDKTIPEEIYVSQTTDSILFVGRYISLGPICSWKNVRNIQCPNLGQMNWSEFRSKVRAQEILDNHRSIVLNKYKGIILSQDSVELVFEGNDISALRIKYQFKIPTFIMGGSNILIIYFVVAEVRNKFVSCVLSHYTDDFNASTLPPLLNEVMQLK